MHVYSNASIKEFVDQKTQEVKLFMYQGCKSHIYSSYSLKHLTLIHFSKWPRDLILILVEKC